MIPQDAEDGGRHPQHVHADEAEQDGCAKAGCRPDVSLSYAPQAVACLPGLYGNRERKGDGTQVTGSRCIENIEVDDPLNGDEEAAQEGNASFAADQVTDGEVQKDEGQEQEQVGEQGSQKGRDMPGKGKQGSADGPRDESRDEPGETFEPGILQPNDEETHASAGEQNDAYEENRL